MAELQRNNHYVPRLYLEGWASKEKLFEYRLLVSSDKVPIWTSKNINGVASQENLYMRIVDGNERDDFEHEFNRLYETPAVQPLQKLRSGHRVTKNEWTAIINFITAQYVRTPSYYSAIKPAMDLTYKEFIENDMPALIDRYTKEKPPHKESKVDNSLMTLSMQLTGEKTDDEHQLAYISAISGKSTWLFSIKHSLEGDSVLRTIFNRKWSDVTMPDGIRLPTNDSPVSINDVPSNLVLDSIYTNIPHGGKILLFPISPDKALISKVNGTRFPPFFTASYDFALYLRDCIIRTAFMFIYSDFEDNNIPLRRPRTVNEDEYKRISKEFADWYGLYQSQEAPFLHSEPPHIIVSE